MYKETVTYEGTITGSENFADTLKEMGITYETYDGESFLGCVASPEAVDKLDAFWGNLYWSLDRRIEIEEMGGADADADADCCVGDADCCQGVADANADTNTNCCYVEGTDLSER